MSTCRFLFSEIDMVIIYFYTLFDMHYFEDFLYCYYFQKPIRHWIIMHNPHSPVYLAVLIIGVASMVVQCQHDATNEIIGTTTSLDKSDGSYYNCYHLKRKIH